MSEPSEAYDRALAATKGHHKLKAGKTFSGAFLFKDHRRRVADLIVRYGAESLLDYGCGWGKQYTECRELADGSTIRYGQPRFTIGRTLAEIFGIDPVKYDPAVPHFSAEPEGKFDGVMCVQVLGCIPTADLPWVVDRMYGFANKFLFVAERVGIVPRKPIHDHMRAEMPHGTSAEGWLEHLRRPGSPVRLILATRDQTTGEWSATEPEDQG